MPLTLTFDEETHRYALGGVEIPGVSFVLDHFGIEKIPYPAGDYRARGKAVHKAALLLDQNRLGRVDPRIEGYLASYESFRRDFPLKWDLTEAALYCPNPVYAGTLDRGHRADLVLADLKTGTPPKKRLGLQTAAYAKMAFNGKHRQATRYGVELDPGGGRYKLHICDDPADFEVWDGLVHRFHWERKK